MKKNSLYQILTGVILCISLFSCKKSEYLTDDGVHNAVTPLTNYDYLKQHSWNSFDSVIAIIDHFGLKDEFNQAGTVFAPTDYSVKRLFALLTANRVSQTEYTMDSLYKHITADSVRQYLFTKQLTLEAATDIPELITSKGNTTCAIEKFLQTAESYYEWGSAPVYSLYYIRVRGSLDDPNATPLPNDPNTDTRVLCQTTGIKTDNGKTLMHVLANTHVFVRF